MGGGQRDEKQAEREQEIRPTPTDVVFLLVIVYGDDRGDAGGLMRTV